MRPRTSTNFLRTLFGPTPSVLSIGTWPALGFSVLMDDNDGGGDGGGAVGGGSGDAGGDGKGKVGDGDGGGGKNGDGGGGERGKDGLLADAGKKIGGDGNGGDGNGNGGKGAASGDGGKGETTVTLLNMDERPDWLPENYYDKENKGVHLQSLVKAERDLRSKVAEHNKGKPAAPDKSTDYVFEFDGAAVKDDEGNVLMAAGDKPHTVEKDDPIVRAFADAAHAEGMPQDVFQRIAQRVQTEIIRYSHANFDFFDKEVEVKKLGEGGKALMEGIHTWLGGLVARGTMSKAIFNEFMEMGKYAEGIKGIALMRTLTGEQAIPIIPALEGGDAISDEDLHALVGTEKYQKDPAEQKRVRELFVKRYGTQAGGVSPAGLGVHTPAFTNKPVKRA